jgi:hypothetical protein
MIKNLKYDLNKNDFIYRDFYDTKVLTYSDYEYELRQWYGKGWRKEKPTKGHFGK